MKRSVLIRLSCLCVALVVLAGALAVSALNGSPYETLKNALLDALAIDNATVSMEARLTVDGVEMEFSRNEEVVGETASLTRQYDELGQPSHFSYDSENLSLRPGYTAPDGTEWYSASRSWGYGSRNYGSILGLGSLTQEDRDSATVRFATLAVDALVGDLKNNIVMSESDGMRRISGTLTSAQIPELVRAGIDMLLETSQYGDVYRERILSVDYAAGVRRIERVTLKGVEKSVSVYEQTFERVEAEADSSKYWDNGKDFYGFFCELDEASAFQMTVSPSAMPMQQYAILGETLLEERHESATPEDYGDNWLSTPMSGLDVSYVHGEADVDASGNLRGVSVSGTATVTDIFGTRHNVEVSLRVEISDIGTSNAVCPIPGAEELLTEQYLDRNFGKAYGGMFYFKLLPDGSIDLSSVTTTYPGERNETIADDSEAVSVELGENPEGDADLGEDGDGE